LENFPLESRANRKRTNNKSGKLLAAPIEIEVQACRELLKGMGEDLGMGKGGLSARRDKWPEPEPQGSSSARGGELRLIEFNCPLNGAMS